MSMIYKANAYGKINLYLDVLDRLENGYHNIESVMQSVSLCDTITLELFDIQGENTIEILTSSGKIPNDKSNLVYKCASKFLEYTNIKGKRCVFSIEKNIPIAAGMAGGSSDGAIAMKLLNEACGIPLTYEKLCKLGATVGADIPFCITGGTCICKGIGDKITKIKPFKDVFIVCAIDNSSVSTPTAFALIDEKYGTNCSSSRCIEKIVDAIETGDVKIVSSLLYNKFENVIIPTNKSIERIKNILLDNGAVGALMSGSGPSVFGIFLDEFSQKKAYDALKNCSINTFLCKTI